MGQKREQLVIDLRSRGRPATAKNGASAMQPIHCDECRRPAAYVLQDGSLRIESRHGGKRHVTIVYLDLIAELKVELQQTEEH